MSHPKRSLVYDIALFLALVATALALGGALAHALELLNKIGMSRDEYFIVQRIYSGWNRLAYLLAVQLAGIVAVITMSRRHPRLLWPAVVALVCLFGAQAVFWTFTYPANVATENWTVAPPSWEELRTHWEYSHAVGALFQMVAMGSLIVAALARARIEDAP